MKRASGIYFQTGRDGEKIVNVRVGGHAVQSMASESLI